MIPDIEAVLTTYLATETAERIVGTTPSDISTPWVRLTQIDAAKEAKSRPERLIEFLVQLDCYAGRHKLTSEGQAEASELAREVRDALVSMEGVYSGVTVTAVKILGMLRSPDTSIEPARERFIITAQVFAHS